jgi:hypothetical protein
VVGQWFGGLVSRVRIRVLLLGGIRFRHARRIAVGYGGSSGKEGGMSGGRGTIKLDAVQKVAPSGNL